MATDPGDMPAPGGKNPNALSLADMAYLLTTYGGKRITVEMLEANIADGCPTNEDGTLHLVQLGAWLLKERGRGAK